MNHGTSLRKPEQRALLLTCLGLIAVFIACSQIHWSAPAYNMPGGTGSTVSTGGSYAPHNPAIGAAIIGGEAKAAGHAARFAGRMAFRGGIMRGIGRGFGGSFGGGPDTGGGIGFSGFGFGGF